MEHVTGTDIFDARNVVPFTESCDETRDVCWISCNAAISTVQRMDKYRMWGIKRSRPWEKENEM